MSDERPKKPIIYLLVILPVLVFGGTSVVVALLWAYSHETGVPMSDVPNLNGLLISLAAFILWIPVSLLIGNLILFSVPPFRRVVEQYISQAHRPGFSESQRLLLKAALRIAFVSVPLIALGFYL